MRYFIIIAIMTFALVGIIDGVRAEDASRVGYVDLSRVFDEYNKTKDLDKQLENESEDKQNQRENKVSEIRRLKDELELLSEKAREKKQAVIDEKIIELQDFDRDSQTELKRERDAMVRDILQEIDKVVEEYGESEKYSLIFNDRVLLYGYKEADLTNDIIRTLNERYKK